MLNIVLHEPEIPFNTGAIGRTCVATNTPLHLIRPYGFTLSDKYIKRAGMDYWAKLNLSEYDDYEDFLHQHPEIRYTDDFCEKADDGQADAVATAQTKDSAAVKTEGGKVEPMDVYSHWTQEIIETPKIWFATTKGRNVYSDAKLGPNDYIMFGKESAGIPEEILVQHPRACIRIPMWGDMRSLNLSNSVAILLYEAYRQNDFQDLSRYGELHRLHW